MADKRYMSEEKLMNIIMESIMENIGENSEEEGLGIALGNAYQWARNKYNNFKKDFEAGRRNQRIQNLKYSPFDYYRKKGYSEDQINNMRKMDAGTFSNGRKDFVSNDMYPNYQNGKSQGSPQTTSNPDLAPEAPQQTTQQTQPVVNNNRDRSGIIAKSKNASASAATFLKNKGFSLINGQWLYTKDGSNHPALQSQYPDIVQAAKKYAAAVRGTKGQYAESKRKRVTLSEDKLINLIYEEVKKSINNKKARG